MRLFVALELPAAARAALHAAVPDPPPEGLRAVPADSLHLTLCFLGDVPDPAPILDAMNGDSPPPVGCESPFMPVEVVGPVWLPRRRPRVLAVELGDPGGALTALSARVHAALGRTLEHRGFLPHVTIARVRRHLDAPPALVLPRLAPVPLGPLSLIRSYLGVGPARYERLAVWPIR